MKKIRYLLALSNIKPTGAQRAKMATAVLRGAEKKEQRAGMKNVISTVKKVFIIIIAAAALLGAVFAAYKIATSGHGPKDEITTEKQHADPPKDQPKEQPDYMLITPLYQNSRIYDLFSSAALRTNVYLTETDGVRISLEEYGIVTSEFCADIKDYKDIVTSLFAFAEPDKIDESGYTSSRYEEGGERRELILATACEGTFEYIVSFTVIVDVDNNVYMQDFGLLSDLSSDLLFEKQRSVSSSDVMYGYWRRAGYIYEDKPGSCSYVIDANLLTTARIAKIRIEGSLPVTYEVNYMPVTQTPGQNGYLYLKTLDPYTKDKTSFCTVKEIADAGGGRVYTTEEKEPVSIGADLTDVPDQYFSAPPQSMRRKICSIINKSGCDWFFYLCTREFQPVGVALYLTDGAELTDCEGNKIISYFDPYSSATPTFDFTETEKPAIVMYDGSGGFTVLSENYPELSEQLIAEYEKLSYSYLSNTRYFTAYDIKTRVSGFSAEAFASPGDLSEQKVYEATGKLLDYLGIGYKERFTVSLYGKNLFEGSDNVSVALSGISYKQYSLSGATGCSYRVTDTKTESFIKISQSEMQRLESNNGKTYRLDKIAGYKPLDNGFVLDLDGRIIGAFEISNNYAQTHASNEPELTMFYEPTASLYVLSDGEGLLYIGTELPDHADAYLPFEYLEFESDGGDPVKFGFGYLDVYTGPFVIPTEYRVDRAGANVKLYVNYNDPYYSVFPYFEYDEKTQTVSVVRRGIYRDRFVQNAGGTAYRKEVFAGRIELPMAICINITVGDASPE